MLDVHAPHKPIDNVREFLLHLLTITIGLLIAVGIEAAVTRHEHKELAREARETMRAEIERNADRSERALRQIGGEQKLLQQNLAAVRSVQEKPDGPAADNANLDLSFSGVDMETGG